MEKIFSLSEVANIRILNKRTGKESFQKYYDKAPDKVKKQYAAGQYKEYKVQLVSTQINDYQELWKVVGEEEYFSRYTYYTPRWYYVCDPTGYAELDRPVEESTMFVVCDDNGNPMFGTSNLYGAIFPTFEEKCKAEWDRIKGDYPHSKDDKDKDFWSQWLGAGTSIAALQWLLTFKDPAIYGDKARDYDENWCFWKEIVSTKAISEFTYLGNRYGIFDVTYEHTVCKKQITEYWIGTFEQKEFESGVEESGIFMDRDNLIMFLDSTFTGEPGTMYLKREAINLVADGLKEIYDNEEISEILNSLGYVYERFISYPSAAERLLKGNWNKEYVRSILENEKTSHTFWKVGDPAIEEKYPGYARDSKWNYDYAGRRIA